MYYLYHDDMAGNQQKTAAVCDDKMLLFTP